MIGSSDDSILNPDEETTYLIMLSSSEVGEGCPGHLELTWRRLGPQLLPFALNSHH